MPEISRFLGIIIRMFADEHAPPHFHAIYGGYEIIVEIKTRIVQGKFPPRSLRAVLEWAELHERELMRNWELLQGNQSPEKIEPLE